MKIEILAAAQPDIVDGFHFYEKQAPDIGDYFPRNICADIDSPAVNAGVHSVHFQKYHCLLSKRFPFAVYYRIERPVAGEPCVKVCAILDVRRNPAWTRNRLDHP